MTRRAFRPPRNDPALATVPRARLDPKPRPPSPGAFHRSSRAAFRAPTRAAGLEVRRRARASRFAPTDLTRHERTALLAKGDVNDATRAIRASTVLTARGMGGVM